MSKLPILMYHNVCQRESESNKLTISAENLEKQFQYLIDNDFKTLHFAALENLESVPEKSIVLTFDDVTENQLTYVVPLLEKFNLKASFFIPFHFIGKTDLWNNNSEDAEQKIMNIEQLKELPKALIELGYHSYEHKKYRLLTASEIENDFLKCEEFIKNNDLHVYRALAYPYGNYPKERDQKANFKNILVKNKIKFGLKIGNRPNTFPFKDNYEIKRIDIKGKDSLLVFRLKIKFGKLKLF
ncbi:polysaccharide deacetylase family protein [Flavobacterium reichenbachii]|uniref:Polysaccharide deacetylase n=1 Tax=Flavobacterium reichenbachii TaxID=362418 RepID=A0A085ZN69_9FLAO|nr:polysaccharide deacetylase family protein [Flavobacterium reichenbachii]KFF05883.1 polysaccharide deacetylase [Flavobacterium reichenbachii]OXB12839.1 polysaccharide deacetylase [Flavobacterium reichenbachii]